VEIIDRHCSYIKNLIKSLKRGNAEVHLYLQGGEVGELPVELIEYLLSKIDSEITIDTNGLFMSKGYHKNPKIRKYIKQILWHVSPDCELIDIDDVTDSIKIIRGVVHPDPQIIESFLGFTKMDIEYSEIEMPLSGKSIVSQDIIRKCRNYHNDITIDLVNERLCLCIRNFDRIFVPLNEDNLIKLLGSFPKDIYDLPDIENSSCYSCCRLCTHRVSDRMFRDRVRLISIQKGIK
jgi:hypothetical protein